MMQIFGILDRYIGKTIFTTVMIMLFILVSLSGIIKFIDQLKKVGQGNYDILGAWVYTLFSIPKDLQIFLPVSILLGVLLGLGILTRFSELIAIQASGFSFIQITYSVIKTITLLILPTIIISEWVAPQGEQIARSYRSQAMYGNSLFSIKHGVWVKDGNNFVYIRYIKHSNELSDINIYIFNKEHRLQLVRYAAIAKFDINKKIWLLSQVNELNLTDLNHISSSQMISDIWKTDLTPDKISIITLNPDTLSIRNLFHYIKYLKTSGQDFRRQQLNIWNKIFQPLSMIIMALMAISFIFGPLNRVSMSIRVITGIIFGFVFHVLNQTLGSLILIYDVHPIIGALLPNTCFLIISLWLLLKHS